MLSSPALAPVLGVPFGQVVRVVGEVRFRPGAPGAKAEPGVWRLKVTEVEGKALEAPVELNLERGWSAPADAVPGAGRHVLFGYETLRAGGMPEGIFRHPELRGFPVSTDVGFQIDRLFGVLKSAPVER